MLFLELDLFLVMLFINFSLKEDLDSAHTPIITASDAEGAGEMFKVTTLI